MGKVFLGRRDLYLSKVLQLEVSGFPVLSLVEGGGIFQKLCCI